MKKWYRIQAKGKNRAKILIYEQIGASWFEEGVTAKKFVKEIDALDVSVIDLHINSPGGSVFDGTSIYNALKDHKAKINVMIDGVAASIASVIAMAGDTVTMPNNTTMMIHDPTGGAYGTAKDMKKMADALDTIKSGMVNAYTDRTGMDDDEISEMMSEETWMTAAEAVEFGFADKVLNRSVKVEANFQAMADFKNVPESIIKTLTKTQEDKPMEINLELITSKHPDIVAAILKTVDLDYVKANCPQIVDTLTAEGTTAGAEAERARIQAIKEQAFPGHEDLIETLMFDGKTTGAEAAVQILKAEKDIRAQALTDNKDDAPPVVAQPGTDDDTQIDPNLPVDERCKAEWAKDKKLHAEFDDVETYIAYMEAEDKGRIKVTG